MISALSVAKQRHEFDVTTNLCLSGDEDRQKEIVFVSVLTTLAEDDSHTCTDSMDLDNCRIG